MCSKTVVSWKPAGRSTAPAWAGIATIAARPESRAAIQRILTLEPDRNPDQDVVVAGDYTARAPQGAERDATELTGQRGATAFVGGFDDGAAAEVAGDLDLALLGAVDHAQAQGVGFVQSHYGFLVLVD